MNIKEQLEKRAKLITDARSVYDLAETEKRNLTVEEKKSVDKMMADAETIKTECDAADADEKRSQSLKDAEGSLKESRGRQVAGARTNTEPETRTIELRKGLDGSDRNVVIPVSKKMDEAFRSFLVTGDRQAYMAETRDLQKDLDVKGGYLSSPMEFNASLIQAVDNSVFMRQISNVLPPLATAASLGIPSLDTDVSDAEWTTELSFGTEDTSMEFGRRELKPHPLAKYIKVSDTLIRRSAVSADSIVRARLAYKMGVTMEKGYLTGTGAGQPLGVFTASNDGIPTGRDVSTGNTSTSMTFDGLKEAKYSLKGQYRNKANWMFHRDGVKQIDKLKDGEGRYIWQPSVVAGQPDRLLNLPLIESEYAPNTFTTGLYTGILGDFSNYWIVDSLSMNLKVAMELFIATNQIGYFIMFEGDGAPVLGEAFARVKLG